MDKFGTTNPVVGIPQYLNTIEDMLALSNIKNPSRYFMSPPDPASPAADRLDSKGAGRHDRGGQSPIREGQVRNRPGDGRPEEIRQQKILADDESTATKPEAPTGPGTHPTEARNRKSQSIRRSRTRKAPTSVDPIEAAKIGVDVHQAHLDANLKSHAHRHELRHRPGQDRPAARSTPNCRAQTAQAAQQSNDDGGGDSS